MLLLGLVQLLLRHLLLVWELTRARPLLLPNRRYDVTAMHAPVRRVWVLAKAIAPITVNARMIVASIRVVVTMTRVAVGFLAFQMLYLLDLHVLDVVALTIGVEAYTGVALFGSVVIVGVCLDHG